MNPTMIVIVTEVDQLPFEILGTPEGNVIQQLSTYCADQPLDEGCDSGTCGTVLISYCPKSATWTKNRRTGSSFTSHLLDSTESAIHNERDRRSRGCPSHVQGT